MRKHRLTDAEAATVLRGQIPADRPDLAALAEAVAEVRHASLQPPPDPSPELAAFLDLDHVSWVSASVEASVPVAVGQQARAPEGSGPGLVKRRIRMFLEWLAGLGVAAKATLGTSVAVASISAAGFGGVLPAPAQDAFDSVVSDATSREDVEGTEAEDVEVPDVPEVASPEGSPETGAEKGAEGQQRGQENGDAGRAKAEEKAAEAREKAAEAEETARQQGAEAEESGRANAPDGAGEPTEAEQDAREKGAEAEDEARESGAQAEEDGVANAPDAGQDAGDSGTSAGQGSPEDAGAAAADR